MIARIVLSPRVLAVFNYGNAAWHNIVAATNRFQRYSNPLSGKLFVLLLAAACISASGSALWYQSHSTYRIRRLWTASGANLIQHAPNVQVLTDEFTREISQSKGLIHLRATLIDDQYYDWRDEVVSTSTPATDDWIRIRFWEQSNSVTVHLNPMTGAVYSPNSRTNVPLIASSQQAVALYVQQLLTIL